MYRNVDSRCSALARGIAHGTSEPIALAALAIWIFLLAGQPIWLASVRDDDGVTTSQSGIFTNFSPRRSVTGLHHKRPSQNSWPAVTVVIPARNEADCIGEAIRSLAQITANSRLSWSTTRAATEPQTWPSCRGSCVRPIG